MGLRQKVGVRNLDSALRHAGNLRDVIRRRMLRGLQAFVGRGSQGYEILPLQWCTEYSVLADIGCTELLNTHRLSPLKSVYRKSQHSIFRG